MKKEIVKQRNSFTYAQHQFTLIEKRIIYNVLCRLDSGINVQPELFSKNMTFSFNWNDLESKYENVLKACRTLGTRQMMLKLDNSKQEFEFVTPFPYCKLEKGVITIMLFEKAIPYFMELKSGFTQFQLKAALSLESKYAQRFYEILSSKIWRENGKAINVSYWRNVEISTIREMLGIELGKLQQKVQFETAVLKIAQREIKVHSDIDFEYSFDNDTKVGKEYKTISFTIYPRQHGAEWQDLKMEINGVVSSSDNNKKFNAAVQAMAKDYQFKSIEKDLILTSGTAIDLFLKVDLEIDNGVRVVEKNRTAYMRAVLKDYLNA